MRPALFALALGAVIAPWPASPARAASPFALDAPTPVLLSAPAPMPSPFACPTLALSAQENPADAAEPLPVPPETAPAEPPRPWFRRVFTFTLTYSLLSDYASRGLVYTDYDGEGAEIPNHQLTTELDIDLAILFNREAASFGTFAFTTWFQWFPALEQIDPIKGGRALQEVDYILSWSYDIEPLHTTFTLGYAFYVVPSWTDTNTDEWYFTLEHNDAWMWKWLLPHNEDPVLTPTYSFYYDTDFAAGAIWNDIGFSHDFQLLEHIVVTPSFNLGVDHHFLGRIQQLNDGACRLATLQYGLNVSYDLTQILGLDKRDWGAVALSGFIYFSEAVGSAKRDGEAIDALWGGTSISWSF